MRTIVLCGEIFEVHKSNANNVAPITGYNWDEIFDVYGRPSTYKVDIWHYWCRWCNDMNKSGYKCGIEISSHNCNFFTISGSVRKDDEVIDIWITARHNRAYVHH